VLASKVRSSSLFWRVRDEPKWSTMSTIEVVTLTRGSAKLGVYSKEHCPPHATCRELSGAWTVRITFSFADASIGLLSVHPRGRIPTSHAINELATAVQRNLPECRRRWWAFQQHNPLIQSEGPCCLNNKTVDGARVMTAAYDPGTSRTTIRFYDGRVEDRVV
jgi:hypothetical protein